jgi:hypothetical protein
MRTGSLWPVRSVAGALGGLETASVARVSRWRLDLRSDDNGQPARRRRRLSTFARLIVLRGGYLELGARVDDRWRRHGAAGALHKVQAPGENRYRAAASSESCLCGRPPRSACVGGQTSGGVRRTAKGSLKAHRGAGRRRSSGQAGAAAVRASIRLFFARPRALHARSIPGRSIDPDQAGPGARCGCAVGRVDRQCGRSRPAARRSGAGAAPSRADTRDNRRRPYRPTRTSPSAPPLSLRSGAKRGSAAGVGQLGRRARRWRSRASGGARPSCSGPPRTPGTRHPPPT